jgi:hypothetical protein
MMYQVLAKAANLNRYNISKREESDKVSLVGRSGPTLFHYNEKSMRVPWEVLESCGSANPSAMEKLRRGDQGEGVKNTLTGPVLWIRVGFNADPDPGDTLPLKKFEFYMKI